MMKSINARAAVGISLCLLGMGLSFFGVGPHYLGGIVSAVGIVVIAFLGRDTKTK